MKSKNPNYRDRKRGYTQGQRIKSEEGVVGDIGVGVEQKSLEVGVVVAADCSASFQAPF